MATIKIRVTIRNGGGRLKVTALGVEDFEIHTSGEYSIDLPGGEHYVIVSANPDPGASITVEFVENGNVIDSHTFKKPRNIPFFIEID